MCRPSPDLIGLNVKTLFNDLNAILAEKIVENIQMEKWQTSWSSWENRNIFMPMGNGDSTGSKEMYKS